MELVTWTFLSHVKLSLSSTFTESFSILLHAYVIYSTWINYNFQQVCSRKYISSQKRSLSIFISELPTIVYWLNSISTKKPTVLSFMPNLALRLFVFFFFPLLVYICIRKVKFAETFCVPPYVILLSVFCTNRPSAKTDSAIFILYKFMQK